MLGGSRYEDFADDPPLPGILPRRILIVQLLIGQLTNSSILKNEKFKIFLTQNRKGKRIEDIKYDQNMQQPDV